MNEAEKLTEEQRGFEPWQRAEYSRVLGEYHLEQGSIKEAQRFLTKSIDLNKKEAKTWMSYAKLN